jgi:amino acid adenylation domain-containing protein
MREIRNFENQFIVAQHNKKEKDYWLDQLSGEIVKSRFPYDHEKGFVSESRQEAFQFSFSEEVSAGLLKISRDFLPNLYAIFTAAVVLLLNKYSGNKDILIGTPVLKQTIEADFINTVLVLRNTVSGEMTFKELLILVRQTIAEATKYQNYPVETLVYNLNLEFNRYDFDLFDAAVLLENIHNEKYLEPIQPNVLFSFVRTPGGIEARVAYNALLYKKATIEQIFNHLQNVLQQVCRYPGIRLQEIELLSREEQHQLLMDFNNNKANFQVDKSVYCKVEEYAACTPGSIALGCNDLALTYEMLNTRANKLARLLKEKGLQPDQRVGILLDRSPLMVLCILAAWKVGATYIPIDTNWPLQRIARVFNDSDPLALFTQSPYIRRYPQLEEIYKNHILVLDLMEQEVSPKSEANLDITFPMNKISYIIYTSGSTGTPKGVMVEHKGMMNHMFIKITDLQLTRTSVVAQNASPCFDISVWQFFAALLVRGKTLIYPDELVLEPPQFLSRLVRNQVTILEVVPSYLAILLDILDTNELALNDLDYILVTGETLKPVLVEKWFSRYPGIKMVNAYGPTEASDDITHHIMANTPGAVEIPIGTPLQNLDIYIVNEDMKLCPIGVKGEICVSGVGVGRGYLNQPELTNDNFSRKPFGGIANACGDAANGRLYKTGDLGCWLPDGTIAFFGRKDHQVKIRGYRIELEEIEKKLADFPGIKEAVVIEKEKFSQDLPEAEPEKHLCAFLLSEKKLDIPGIRAYLEEILPGYMVPKYIESLDQIPLTPNGKVDRKELAQLDITLDDGELAKARNEIERKLVDIWSEVLGIPSDSIGIDSSFFHLGGHSLRAILLVAKVRKEYSADIQLKDIFEFPTIRKFSKFVQSAAKETFLSIEPLEKKEYYPLSSAQKRLFFIQQMEPRGIAYNLPDIYLYQGELDKERWGKTFRQLILRHENFRTSYKLVGEEPVQRIHEEIEFEIEYFRSAGIESGAGKKQEIEEIIDSFIRPFDLSRPPILRVGLIDTGDGNWILMIDEHHIMTDYTSYHILVRDIAVLYTGKPLPPVRVHYKDYSVFQNSVQQREKMKKQEQYWLKEFEGEIPVLDFPTDFPRPEVFDYNGNKIYFEISGTLFARLKELILETDTTLFMVLLAVLNALLARYTMKEDIIVGSATAGRNHADLQHVIGMFINMLALRNYPGKDKTFGQFLEEVKEKLVNAYDNENYQFDELVGKLGLQGDISKNPLFDVVFQLLHLDNMDADQITVEDFKIMPYNRENTQTHFDLYLEALELEDRIRISFLYSTALFKKSTIEKIADHYLEILSQVTGSKDIKLKEINISHGLSALKSTCLREEQGEFEF